MAAETKLYDAPARNRCGCCVSGCARARPPHLDFSFTLPPFVYPFCFPFIFYCLFLPLFFCFVSSNVSDIAPVQLKTFSLTLNRSGTASGPTENVCVRVHSLEIAPKSL